MRPTGPSAIAMWLLEHVGRRNAALAGDLLEEYRSGRSAAWYWRQVLVAILARPSKEALLVLALFALYRIGRHIPVAGADPEVLAQLARRATGTTLSRYDLITGGNLSFVSVFALGIAPFVSASILVQVVGCGWWSVTRRHATPWALPIVRSTWIVAVVLALVQAAGVAMFLERQQSIAGGLPFLDAPGWAFRVSTMLMLTAGSACLMCVADWITARHAGNGMFLVFLAALLAGSSLPHEVSSVVVAVRPLVIPLAVVGLASSGYRRAFERGEVVAG